MPRSHSITDDLFWANRPFSEVEKQTFCSLKAFQEPEYLDRLAQFSHFNSQKGMTILFDFIIKVKTSFRKRFPLCSMKKNSLFLFCRIQLQFPA